MASSSESPSKQPIPWLRIGAEGVAIVVSILLAFGIQAWSEGKQARSRPTEHVAGLLEDVTANLSDLGTTIRGTENQVAWVTS